MQLNSTQRRHLYESLAHLDRQLAAIEAILAEPGAAAPATLFPRHRDDVPPTARRQLEAGLAAARERIAVALAGAGLAPEPPAIGAWQAVRSHLSLAEVSTDDVGARSMRGYGELQPESAEQLDRLAATLRAAIAAVLPGEHPAPPAAADLADALEAAAEPALAAMAAALADAVLARRSQDELPLIAGDVLARQACAEAAPRLQRAPESLPAFDIDRIRWRLDKPRLAFGREALVAAFRRQLAPLDGDIRAALRAYASRLR